jgi:histidyl-tRNA synthetase
MNVTTYPTPEKLGRQLRYANRIGTQVAVVLGPDEIKAGQVAVKNLTTRSQDNIPRENAVEHITKMLAGADSP